MEALRAPDDEGANVTTNYRAIIGPAVGLAIFLIFGLFAAFAVFVGLDSAFAAPSQPGRIQRIGAEIRPPSTWIDARVLAANVAETVTVPTFSGERSRAVIIFFSSTCSNFFYASASGVTAAVPAADVTDGSASGRAPTALKFRQAATFSIVADATCVVTMEMSLD